MTHQSELVKVSVPLRGKGRDQLSERQKGLPGPTRFVSVPLRGKGRDQQENEMVYSPGGREGFPSPCGEKVGINFSACLREHYPSERFRPLAGKR